MIKRDIFSELKAHLCKKEVSFIIGPRQAGKTTLMLLLRRINSQYDLIYASDFEAGIPALIINL